jgi:organic hydroperoxide reductase OsmC/OhrA
VSDRAPHVHAYATTLSWSGSTGAGYDAYDRAHRVQAPPASAGLDLSADPAFHGDATRLNPEALLVAAASSCQLLSFLAVAARARIDVVAYTDDAGGEMPEPADRGTPMRVERILLRPRITVRGDASDDRLARLVDLAHRECFIASSLRTRPRTPGRARGPTRASGRRVVRALLGGEAQAVGSSAPCSAAEWSRASAPSISVSRATRCQ